MKKLTMTLMAVVMAIAANAQYNVGTSSRYTDSFGNTSTTHSDPYGQRTGTSSTYTDGFGNTTTTHQNRYGQNVGSSSSYTDFFGNTTTNQRSNNPYTEIWSW